MQFLNQICCLLWIVDAVPLFQKIIQGYTGNSVIYDGQFNSVRTWGALCINSVLVHDGKDDMFRLGWTKL